VLDAPGETDDHHELSFSLSLQGYNQHKIIHASQSLCVKLVLAAVVVGSVIAG